MLFNFVDSLDVIMHGFNRLDQLKSVLYLFLRYKCLLCYNYTLCQVCFIYVVIDCDQGLENAAQGCRTRAAFSSPRSQFSLFRLTLIWQIIYSFFPAVNWLTNGLHNFVFELVYVPSTNHCKNLMSERVSNLDTR